MYSIRKQFIRFYSTCEMGSLLLKSLNFNNKKKFIFASGVVNYIWQTWSQFWRTFWLAYILGGENIQKNYIHPYWRNKTENEAIYFILHLLGRRTSVSGTISGPHQEPTWGDKDVIEKTANEVARWGITNAGTRVLSCFSVLGDTPKHFQVVRNASIHLNKHGYDEVKRIMPYYVISDLNYPTDVLFCKELRTGKMTFQHWADDLITVILLVCN